MGIFSEDGACDDGGSGSDGEYCIFGNDCTDCGPRPVTRGCNDDCMWSNDGECDEPTLCDTGEDCTDCGGESDDPCASCLSNNLHRGQECLSSPSDGTCSTPDDAYYCFDQSGNLPVQSCASSSSLAAKPS